MVCEVGRSASFGSIEMYICLAVRRTLCCTLASDGDKEKTLGLSGFLEAGNAAIPPPRRGQSVSEYYC
jgi:hypothetical protein